MKTNSLIYRVKYLDPSRMDWWKDAEQARADHFPWGGENDYRPSTCARLGTDGASLFVFMETDETDIRAETRGFGFVHTDSCMEFFISPLKSPFYLNFEFNAAAAMYLSIGNSRFDRKDLPIENYSDFFHVKTAVHEKGWNLEFHIPLSFLKNHFPDLELKQGAAMRGNFYKCGDKTARPHYGCWSPIDLPAPDFHCPDFFGTFILV